MGREYYLKNREKILVSQKIYYQKTKIHHNEVTRQYYYKNHDKALAQKHEYYEKNKKKLLEQQKEYHRKNKERLNKQKRDYAMSHKVEATARLRKWRANNRERERENSKKWRAAHPENVERSKLRSRTVFREKNNAYKRVYYKAKRQNDINHRISSRLRSGLRIALEKYGDGKHWHSTKYGIDYAKIAEHLGEPPNDGQNWVIDHIRPLCSFDLTEPQQVKDAMALENLRWLTYSENAKKVLSDKAMSVVRKRMLISQEVFIREGFGDPNLHRASVLTI